MLHNKGVIVMSKKAIEKKRKELIEYITSNINAMDDETVKEEYERVIEE